MSLYTFVRGFTAYHDGVDLSASRGTPIHAVAGGTIRFAGWGGAVLTSALESGGGNVVEIAHGTSFDQYAHLDTILVSQGATVAAGQVIGTVGSTGFATGPHLHFGIRVTTSPSHWIDPLSRYSLAVLEAAVAGATTAGPPIPSSGGTGTGATPATGGALLDGFLASIHRTLTDPVRLEDVLPFVNWVQTHTNLLIGTEIPILFPGPLGAAEATLFNGAALAAAVALDVGHPWSKIGTDLLGQADAVGNAIPNAIAGAAGAVVGAVFGALAPFLVDLTVLVVIVLLAYRGLRGLLEPV